MGVDLQRLAVVFEDVFDEGPPTVISEAPGRVNLIGEHTDYNGGFVLPVAIDRTIAVVATPSSAPRIRAVALDIDECDDFALDAIERVPHQSWRNYARGCAWALKQAGYPLRGGNLAITGDIPQGAGLSSSAALELAVAGALCALAETTVGARELALMCQRAENEFVGVQCGIMDQLTAALGQAGHALLIDCRSLTIVYVPVPAEIAIMVVDSKVARVLANTQYNLRSEECVDAARLLGVESLRGADEPELARLAKPLDRRARHVVTENQRVLAAVDALSTPDMARLGALLYASHTSLRDYFEVSTPELDLLVDLARSVDGVIGARLTGAGFGGCTVNLIRQEAVTSFGASVIEPYRQRTGLSAEMHVCRSSDALKVSAVGGS